MDKLKEWFEEDCGATYSESLYEAYKKGYIRAEHERLEKELFELKLKSSFLNTHAQINDTIYNNYGYRSIIGEV